MAARVIVRIELPEETWDKIGRLTAKQGMTQLYIHSRLIEWFCDQPDEVKGAVLAEISAKMPGSAARLILKNMQRYPRSG